MKKNLVRKISSRILRLLLLCATMTTLVAHSAQANELDSLKESAEQGDASAQFHLGFMYANGEGIP